MNRTAKIWLITAGVLVVLGPAIIVAAAAAGGFNLMGSGVADYKTVTHELGSTFDQIAVHADITDIEIATADEKQCRVDCTGNEKITHTAEIQDGTLVVESNDTRKWYERVFSFSFKSPKITLYLPVSSYTSLQIDTRTGDILIPAGLTFDTVDINGSTSDLSCSATVPDSLTLKTSTGNISLEGADAGGVSVVTSTGNISVVSTPAKGDMTISSDTGNIRLDRISCKNLTAESDTGDMSLADTTAEESFLITSNTGDIKLDACDAADISVKTSTGDVTGTLLSDKVFLTETSTGDVSVPKTTTGGTCEIKTTTGDIIIDITK